ncbi:trypsin-3-like [Ceratina calcarata]|uniref:Trypsin-3-like n=1 Tax=Ceratina calcarata TaxID=156304 RepID=A0AAJ7JC52_9HYME|nr:trypsin-3-like [Ceratina calcarata]
MYGQHEINFVEEDAYWTSYGLIGRIVNGSKAELKQFPYQISLRRSYSNQHFCGGSLIDKKFVLTAAHCLVQDDITLQPWTILLVGGQINLNDENGQIRGVDKVYVHPRFVEATLQNDIALLRVKVAFETGPYLNVIPMAAQTPTPGTICQVAGWGYPSEDNKETSNSLMYIDLPLISRERCKKLWEGQTDFPMGMMCAGYEDGHKDACQGDSGGGMICNGVLAGVVSGGYGCARPGYPGIYSDVYYYRDWISENTGSYIRVSSRLAKSKLFNFFFSVLNA